MFFPQVDLEKLFKVLNYPMPVRDVATSISQLAVNVQNQMLLCYHLNLPITGKR